MVGGGAALSQLAGGLLTVESGTIPLQWLMFIVSGFAMLSLILVMQRTRKING